MIHARTPSYLLSAEYNRQVFSNPVALPATNLPYLDGVRFIYNLGRYKSYDDDQPELLADLREEYNAARLDFETYRTAWREQWQDSAQADSAFFTEAVEEFKAKSADWQAFDREWIKRVRLRIAAFLIERVTWEREGTPPDPRDQQSLLVLEPQAWAERGETLVLNVLTDPAWLAQEVGQQANSPFWSGKSTASGGKS